MASSDRLSFNVCPIGDNCGSFDTEGGLIDHLNGHHGKIRCICCRICKHYFLDAPALAKHAFNGLCRQFFDASAKSRLSYSSSCNGAGQLPIAGGISETTSDILKAEVQKTDQFINPRAGRQRLDIDYLISGTVLYEGKTADDEGREDNKKYNQEDEQEDRNESKQEENQKKEELECRMGNGRQEMHEQKGISENANNDAALKVLKEDVTLSESTVSLKLIAVLMDRS